MTLRKLLLTAAFAVCGAAAFAQPPERPAQPPKDAQQKDAPKQDDLTAKMMAFDKDKDGKLKKDEITDERLARLFDQIDADKDGTVTGEELKTFAAKADQGGGGGRGGPGGPGGGGPGGPGGEGGRGGRGPGGEGGRGGFGGGFTPPKPGTVLAPFMVEQLKLTDDQKKKLDELQKDVDKQIEKLLTEDQKKTLKEIGERGPGGGPGGPGGGRGPGGGGRPGGGGDR